VLTSSPAERSPPASSFATHLVGPETAAGPILTTNHTNVGLFSRRRKRRRERVLRRLLPTCTFMSTGSEFESQHWYHCRTCGLVEDKGCCVICVRTCHVGHDVQYSRLEKKKEKENKNDKDKKIEEGVGWWWWWW
jgi:hypothetical protein